MSDEIEVTAQETNLPVAPAEGEAQPEVEQPQTSEPIEEGETGAPETEEETTEPPETEEQKRSKFQRRLDRQKAARVAAETETRLLKQRVAELEARSTPQEVSTEPQIAQFETADEYAKAMKEWATKQAGETIKQREQREQQERYERSRSESLTNFQERLEDARDKYSDYDTVAGGNHPVTQAMADAITESDIGPDVAYFLGKNPKEATRIAQLSPLRQIAEIGRLEAKILAEPAVIKTSSAPEPIRPVRPTGKARITDTTDPRSIKDMSDSEWIEAERARQRKKLQGAAR